MKIEVKQFDVEVKESDSKDLTVTHFISTEKIDRGRDILYADGMKVLGRPVVLFMHGWSDVGPEPIAKNIWLKKGEFKGSKGIMAKTQFYPDEMGQRLWKKNVDGYMPSWSVGWRPMKHEYVTDKKTGAEIRHVYEWELLEYSLVGVPMQPDAQTPPGGVPGKEMGSIFFKVLPVEEDKFGEEIVQWQKDDGTFEEKPYPNEHACRLEDPGKYIRMRRQNDKFGKGIDAIWGIQGGNKPVELQAIRFKKAEHTVAQAKAWLKSHDYKCKMFEPASGKCEKCGTLMDHVWTHPEGCKDMGKEGVCSCDMTHEYHCSKCASSETLVEQDEEKVGLCTCSGKPDDKGICKQCNKPKPKEPKKEDKPVEMKMDIEMKAGSLTIGIHMIPTLKGIDPTKEPTLKEVLNFAQPFMDKGTVVTLLADDETSCCLNPQKDDSPSIIPEQFVEKFLDKVKEMISPLQQAVAKINERLETLPAKPEAEKKAESLADNPPEPDKKESPRKVILINSDEERKRADEEKKAEFQKLFEPLSIQVKEFFNKIPLIVKEEIDKARGRVK